MGTKDILQILTLKNSKFNKCALLAFFLAITYICITGIFSLIINSI